jgi:hypothetical protein
MEGVVVGKAAKPRRIVLGGVKGIGKSTWAAGAPKPIFVQAEDGIEDIGAARFPKCESFEELYGRYRQLGEETHDYRTSVTDSLDGVERLIFAEVCRDKEVPNIEEIGYAKGYTFALDYWKKLLACLDYLRDEKGMNVILIAHSKIEKFEDPEQANYDRWTLQLHKHATALITQWADEVFFASYRIFVNKEKTGFGKEKTRAIGTGERLLYTTERPSHVAKNRLDMPDEIDFPKKGGWEVFQKYIEAHHNGTPVESTATPPTTAAKPKTKKKGEGPAAVAS